MKVKILRAILESIDDELEVTMVTDSNIIGLCVTTDTQGDIAVMLEVE